MKSDHVHCKAVSEESNILDYSDPLYTLGPLLKILYVATFQVACCKCRETINLNNNVSANSSLPQR